MRNRSNSQDAAILRMYTTLKRIATGYQTPDQLRRNSEKEYGLSYHESLEMAYENLQAEAKAAVKGVRITSLVKPD
jgi:hypothetical protein